MRRETCGPRVWLAGAPTENWRPHRGHLHPRGHLGPVRGHATLPSRTYEPMTKAAVSTGLACDQTVGTAANQTPIQTGIGRSSVVVDSQPASCISCALAPTSTTSAPPEAEAACSARRERPRTPRGRRRRSRAAPGQAACARDHRRATASDGGSACYASRSSRSRRSPVALVEEPLHDDQQHKGREQPCGRPHMQRRRVHRPDDRVGHEPDHCCVPACHGPVARRRPSPARQR